MKLRDIFLNKDLEPRAQATNLRIRTQSMSFSDVQHLLNRISFSPTPSQIKKYIGKLPNEVVVQLLGDGKDYLADNENRLPDSTTLQNFLNDPLSNPLRTGALELRFQIEGTHRDRYRKFIDWWIDLMISDADDNNSLAREKLTLFWSTVWCVEFSYDTEEFIPPPLLFRNNQKLRKYRLGNYRDMAKEMTLDGAFLLYQSLNQSTGANPNIPPNENYMRELLELFTMGIANSENDTPLYTEADIRIGSRVLTGWRIATHLGEPRPNGYFETYFSPRDHDTGHKDFFNLSILTRRAEDNTEDKVKEEEVFQLVDELFRYRPVAISEFLSEKIFSYFVYSNPDQQDDVFIASIAKEIRDADFELLPVFQKLFSSEEFFNAKYRNCQIKTPPEFVIGLSRCIETSFNRQREAMENLEQVLYDPPNVSGWTGYRSWISTNTYPFRMDIINQIVNGSSLHSLNQVLELSENIDDFDSTLSSFIKFFLATDENDFLFAYIKEELNNKQGLNTNNWIQMYSNNRQQVLQSFKDVSAIILSSPDINLS